MFIILLTPNMTKEVETALSKIKSSHSLLEGIGSNSSIEEKTEIDIDNLAEKCLFKKSPYYERALGMYELAEKYGIQTTSSNSYYSKKFADIVLKKYAAYGPLWTNMMGVFVEPDQARTRISNSPVESYFNIAKHVILKHKLNVRASHYVRKSYMYVEAKIKDIERLYLDLEKPSKKRKVKTIQLEEEQWNRTPKKIGTGYHPHLTNVPIPYLNLMTYMQ